MTSKKRFNQFIPQRLKTAFHQIVERVIEKRIPNNNNITLSQRNIYVLPSKYGVIFLIVAFALFLGGVNYANAMILGFSYLLVSLFVVTMLHTYRNMSGLRIESSHGHNGFVDDDVMFEVNLTRQGKRTHESVTLMWDGEAQSTVNLIDCKESVARLLITAGQRGFYKPGRLRVETNYPLGLFVCWSWLRFDVGAWVYPKPIENKRLRVIPSGGGNQSLGTEIGTDDFSELRRYVPGDSLRRVDWKAYARGEELYTKKFVNSVDDDLWIDWQSFTGVEPELALSYVCYWVLKFSEQNKIFGLRMPKETIDLNKGVDHKIRCLVALAEY